MKMVNKKKAMDLVSKGALLVDMRSPVDYRDGSIKGSVNLPLKNFTNKLIGLKKDQKVVIFGKTINDPDVKSACGYADQLGIGGNIFVTEYKQLLDEAEIDKNY